MDTLQVLADPTRRTIVELLAHYGRMSAGELYRNFNSTPAAISQHLKQLREAQVVYMEKQAQRRLYYLNMSAIRNLEIWTKQITELWKQRFKELDLSKRQSDSTP